MIDEYMKSIWIILPITLATMGLEILRIRMIPREDNSPVPGIMFGYLIAGLVFGWVAILVYDWIGDRWPESVAQIYLSLALGSALVLTLLAIMMRFGFKSPLLDIVIWTVMNFMWAIGYGWFLPQVLSSALKPI